MTTRMHERTRFRPRLGLCFVDDPRSTTAARREARSGRNLAALAATSTFCLSDRACFCSVTLLCFSLSFLDLSHSLSLSHSPPILKPLSFQLGSSVAPRIRITADRSLAAERHRDRQPAGRQSSDVLLSTILIRRPFNRFFFLFFCAIIRCQRGITRRL